MAKTFEKQLISELEGKGKLNLREKRLLNALQDDSPGPLRKARIAAMEQTARNKLGLPADSKVDWSSATIDWKSLLAMILPLILKLLGL